MKCLNASDAVKFFLRSIADPFHVGSFVPSSRALARAMAENFEVSDDPKIIELGAGTGVVTEELLKHVTDPTNFLVVERDETFVEHLKNRFPRLSIQQAQAEDLDEIHLHAVTGVVSSLPMRNFGHDLIDSIMAPISRKLTNGGLYIQYTYLPMCPIPRRLLSKYGFRVKSKQAILSNIPPAFVWVFSKS